MPRRSSRDGNWRCVLTALKKRATRLPNVQMNLAIVRLACCCGLRASEIGGLTLGDVNVGIADRSFRSAPSTPSSAARAVFRSGGTRERLRT